MKRHAHVLTTRQQHFKLASSTQTHGMCKTRTGLFLVLRQTERKYATGRRGRKSTGHACTGSALPECLCHPRGCHYQCNASMLQNSFCCHFIVYTDIRSMHSRSFLGRGTKAMFHPEDTNQSIHGMQTKVSLLRSKSPNIHRICRKQVHSVVELLHCFQHFLLQAT